MANVKDHPEPGILEDFALGRLDSEAMERVERTSAPARPASESPRGAADRLVALIRRAAPQSPTSSKS